MVHVDVARERQEQSRGLDLLDDFPQRLILNRMGCFGQPCRRQVEPEDVGYAK